MTDPSFKGVIYTCDLEHKLDIFYSDVPATKAIIVDSITKSFYAVGFLSPNLWNERFQEIVDGLITGGIINQYMKGYIDSMNEFKFEDLKADNVILNLSHLGFGFQICFFVLYSSLLVFLIELLVFWGSVCYKNKKLKAFQIVLNSLNEEAPKKHQNDQIESNSELENRVISNLEVSNNSLEHDAKLLDKAFGEDLSKINKIEILLSDVETLYEKH